MEWAKIHTYPLISGYVSFPCMVLDTDQHIRSETSLRFTNNQTFLPDTHHLPLGEFHSFYNRDPARRHVLLNVPNQWKTQLKMLKPGQRMLCFDLVVNEAAVRFCYTTQCS
jgi:hypothetical protein